MTLTSSLFFTVKPNGKLAIFETTNGCWPPMFLRPSVICHNLDDVTGARLRCKMLHSKRLLIQFLPSSRDRDRRGVDELWVEIFPKLPNLWKSCWILISNEIYWIKSNLLIRCDLIWFNSNSWFTGGRIHLSRRVKLGLGLWRMQFQ